MSQVANGFDAKLNKADEPEVLALMEKHPLWKKSYARRTVASRKLFRILDAVNAGRITKEQAKLYLAGKGTL